MNLCRKTNPSNQTVIIRKLQNLDPLQFCSYKRSSFYYEPNPTRKTVIIGKRLHQASAPMEV